MDMQYGLAKNGSCLISSIARSIDEKIKLNYTIDRLCDNLSNLYQDENNIIWNNYLDEVEKNIDKENAIALFNNNEEYNLTLSYKKAILPYNKKEYTLVIVYNENEMKPMKLLTNIEIKEKEDVIKIVRLYLSRWRIEEHFRGKKQEYDFENMRVRTLESMNNLNMILTIHLGHISILADNINNKLLTLKIIYASKSLKDKAIVWLSQIARGIKEILKYAHNGIKEWMNIETRSKEKQLALKL